MRYHQKVVEDEKAYQKLSDVFRGVFPFRPKPNLYLKAGNVCPPPPSAGVRAHDQEATLSFLQLADDEQKMLPLWVRLELASHLRLLVTNKRKSTPLQRGSMWKPTAEEPTCHKAFVRRTALGRDGYDAEAFGQPWSTQAEVAKRVTPRQDDAVRVAILEMTGG